MTLRIVPCDRDSLIDFEYWFTFLGTEMYPEDIINSR